MDISFKIYITNNIGRTKYSNPIPPLYGILGHNQRSCKKDGCAPNPELRKVKKLGRLL